MRVVLFFLNNFILFAIRFGDGRFCPISVVANSYTAFTSMVSPKWVPSCVVSSVAMAVVGVVSSVAITIVAATVLGMIEVMHVIEWERLSWMGLIPSFQCVL